MDGVILVQVVQVDKNYIPVLRILQIVAVLQMEILDVFFSIFSVKKEMLMLSILVFYNETPDL